MLISAPASARPAQSDLSPVTMWCKICRQDVPGIASTEEGQFSCARCGAVMLAGCEEAVAAGCGSEATRPDESSSAGDSADESMLFPPLQALDNWELDEQLRHVERVLHGGRLACQPPGGQRGMLRYDAAQSSAPAHLSASAGRAPRVAAGVSALTWLLLAAAVAAFTCGAVLVAWGVLAARDDLWNLGLPVVLVSQVALLIALVMHLDVLSGGRRAADNRHEHHFDNIPNVLRQEVRYRHR